MDAHVVHAPIVAGSRRQAAESNGSPPPVPTQGPGSEVPIMDVLTLVLWVCCAAVGIAGLNLPYPKPTEPSPGPAAVEVEILQVELTDDPLPTADPLPPLPDSAPPPLPPLDPTLAPTTAPPLTAVAAPSAAIAFAIPVEGPVRIVPMEQASPPSETNPAPTNSMASTPLPLQQISFGRGEGRQPAPDYPYAAAREGQEGVVTVRFTVGEAGRVLAAEVSAPCPWPLLNQAAERAIRERWRFQRGSPRLYEVGIRFELNK